MYKVSDILTCKSSFTPNSGDVQFLEGCEYVILDIKYYDNIRLSLMVGYKKGYRSYTLRNFYYFNSYLEICDVFYTKQELRKLKLESLSNV